MVAFLLLLKLLIGISLVKASEREARSEAQG